METHGAAGKNEDLCRSMWCQAKLLLQCAALCARGWSALAEDCMLGGEASRGALGGCCSLCVRGGDGREVWDVLGRAVSRGELAARLLEWHLRSRYSTSAWG